MMLSEDERRAKGFVEADKRIYSCCKNKRKSLNHLLNKTEMARWKAGAHI